MGRCPSIVRLTTRCKSLGRDLSVAPGASHFTFLPRGGRAPVFPIYQGTFQRFGEVGEFPKDDQMNAYRDMVVQWSKDLSLPRSLIARAARRVSCRVLFAKTA